MLKVSVAEDHIGSTITLDGGSVSRNIHHGETVQIHRGQSVYHGTVTDVESDPIVAIDWTPINTDSAQQDPTDEYDDSEDFDVEEDEIEELEDFIDEDLDLDEEDF